MITATAPAASAFAAFSANVHVPRWTRATLPAVKLAKSPAAHPLLDELAVGARRDLEYRPASWIAAVTSPEPEYSMIAKSSAPYA